MSDAQIDRAVFDELESASGSDFIGELVATFLDDAPKLIDELRQALQSGNAESFRRAAHSLKSNGATFGAMQFSQLARDLEMLGKEQRLAEAGDRVDRLDKALALVAGELKGFLK